MPEAKGRGSEKRDRILRAGRTLFLRQGLRATTMEAIAREAQIAKPTLYAHFPDKHAIFSALLEQLIADKHVAFDAALTGDGALVERIGRALGAKFGVISRTLEGSAHVTELFAAHHEGAALFERSNALIADKLAAVLTEAGVADAKRLSLLLLAAAKGVAEAGITSTQLSDDLMLLSERLVGPELRR
ncbi:TetR/AcrR family transcriptional regulator [Devosia sediminis]|uniref:TetR/AcrR family transcriptional regulator n=1 Tax=Devosia sediminis TaxID=2798801 RepID=A0A934MMQ7_9HYPH|nr:TetR/AcrR family transcriptional regulator [Devosia sediminis]MBJ3786465.1 TetR/AcrR family transcriptional regulator [Devosia sediminis]